MGFSKSISLLTVLVTIAACRSTSMAPAGRDVVTTVDIPASPERALSAFLSAEDLAEWWGVSRSRVDEEVGGTWAVTWDQYGEDKTSHVWTGVIREIGARRVLIGDVVMVEPGHRLFAPLEIEILAKPKEGGCVLSVSHRGYQHGVDWDWLHQNVVVGWKHVLADLQVWFMSNDN